MADLPEEGYTVDELATARMQSRLWKLRCEELEAEIDDRARMSCLAVVIAAAFGGLCGAAVVLLGWVL